jgi:hypothetical protein
MSERWKGQEKCPLQKKIKEDLMPSPVEMAVVTQNKLLIVRVSIKSVNLPNV